VSVPVLAVFVRSVPGVSIGYQKHLLSLKAMTSQTEKGPWSFTGGFGLHGSQWVKPFLATFAISKSSVVYSMSCDQLLMKAR